MILLTVGVCSSVLDFMMGAACFVHSFRLNIEFETHFLYVIICQRITILQLRASKNESLFIRAISLLISNSTLQI